MKELIERERAALGAYAHQDVPFEKVVEELQPARDLSRHPLFQVMFVYQNEADQTGRIGGLRMRPFGIANRTAKFDLSLRVAESSE